MTATVSGFNSILTLANGYLGKIQQKNMKSGAIGIKTHAKKQFDDAKTMNVRNVVKCFMGVCNFG